MKRHISDPKQFGKVAVLMGGTSAEREVSLRSGAAVLAALQRQEVAVEGVDVGKESLSPLLAAEYDRCFVILHGRGGEDGTMQGLLELVGLPYTGSGVMASALGMDKWRSKLLWRAAGLPVPECEILSETSDFTAVEKRLGLPLFVKPANEGSSVGISKVTRAGELATAYRKAAEHDSLVLAEQFIGAGEYTVAILGNEPLPMVKIEPKGDFYDYEAKYLSDETAYLCPCGLPDEKEREIQQLAMQAFEVLGCHGWGRIDILLDNDGKAYLLEANTLPGMTDHSLVPMAAQAAGIGFDDLVWRILESSVVTSHDQAA